jgi:hypothetical protein
MRTISSAHVAVYVVLFAAAATVASVERAPAAHAQARPAARAGAGIDPALFSGLRWRSIGPDRGGRSIAVGGSAARPFEYYFGATGGGVWKTTDAGQTWTPVTDRYLKTSSVGAIAVAESNPDVVYVGMGEVALRGNVIQGDGVYKTTDGGRTWSHAGLEKTMAIGRIRVHPSNPDIVYVAALGDPYGRTGSGASSRRPTAARRGIRCCSATRRRAPSTCRWTRSTPTRCMRGSGRSSGRRIRSRAAVRAAGCSRRRMAARAGRN